VRGSERKGGGAWPAQGQWTYADYRRLPENGRRYEIIRGTLFVTGAPDYDHQFVVHKLHRLLGNPVEEKGWGLASVRPSEFCYPVGSPIRSSRTSMRQLAKKWALVGV
jgi:hypothetical protein